MKKHKFVFAIAIILFIVPFFWLKPGEMNLGGDSGRLYFYDPSSYLKNNSLYNFIGSGKGSETHSYPTLPYVILLVLLKRIFQSPTILISLLNGVALTSAFLSVYFTISELIKTKENDAKDSIITLSAILGGLFYLFSQISISNGWENPLLTHSQIFLNPLIFFLLLKFLLTRKVFYVLTALLTTAIFSFNFSFLGAPQFFSFYPLALTFLFCYIKFIRELPIPYKALSLGVVLFLLLHVYHLVPEISGLFSLDSTFNKAVFVQEGEGARGGLDYFVAIAANVKLSLIWMTVAQQQEGFWLSVFIVFPLILIGGFFLNRGRTFLLTGMFFLIVFFFAAANITDLGFSFYKLLFRVPGFSMFRNFHGQWAYSFMFFYALLFGQAIAIVSSRFQKRLLWFLFIGLFAAVVSSGLPLIIGRASIITHTDTGLRYTFQMDPVYEEVLRYLKAIPIDGKVISFPLVAPGYQVFQGKDGGVYQGLSTISYLTGKSDFAGFESISPFHEKFLEFIQKQDFESLKKLLSIMNIKYIFYNSDPFILSEAFKGYLYSHVSKFTPKDQGEYKSFIEKLPLGSKIDFGDNYHIYTVNYQTFMPHIFATTDIAYTNNPFLFSINTNVSKNQREVPVFIESSLDKKNTIVLFGAPYASFLDLKNNLHLHRHEPYVSVGLDNPFYAVVLLKESYELFRAKNRHDRYIDLSLFFLTKRVTEIVEFGDFIPILNHDWEEPRLWEVLYRWKSYNSWEASLVRYEKGMVALMDWVSSSTEPETWKEVTRIKIREQLFRHQIEFIKGIRNITMKKDQEKEYLLSLVETIFDRLFEKVEVPIYDPSRYNYRLPKYTDEEGTYTVFLEKEDIRGSDFDKITISSNDEILKPLKNTLENPLIQFPNQTLDKNRSEFITATIPPYNLLKDANWTNSGSVHEENGLFELSISNKIGEHTKGLTIEIPGWKQENQYLISFDYLTFGDDFLFSLYDKKYKGDKKKDFTFKQFFEKRLSSKEWKTHQTFIIAEEGSLGAFLQISSFSSKDQSAIHIKNLTVTEIRYPNLIFKKVSTMRAKTEPPRIGFTKINPTKYRVHVEGAKNPYTLVFLESFNRDWKLFNLDEDSKTFAGSLFRIVGTLGKSLVFLAPSTFETWGKSSIAEKTHFKTFEYANAWYISPDDVIRKENYDLIIELDSHRFFYMYLGISLVALILALYFFFRSIAANYKNG